MFENLKTVMLLGLLSAILIIICDFMGGYFGIGRLGSVIGLVIAIIMNFSSYYFSDKIALRSYNATIVDEQQSPNLHRIISELANNAGIKKPRIAIIKSDDPNAFATGRNQENAVVAVTTGILNLLDEDELRGVLSHELGHIKNKDILISSVAATIAAGIVFIGNSLRFATFFTGGDNDNAGAIIASLALAILGPIAASIIQLSISRSREYNADATGAKICGKPLALASALRKLEMGTIQHPMRNARSTDAHMFIVNPFGNLQSTMQKLFSTHPPTAERIRRLEEMAGSQLY